MSKLVFILLLLLISMTAVAGRCKLCRAQIMGSRVDFCSACKYTPEAKKMQKEAKDRALLEKQKKEQLEQQKKPLNLKSFLGFEFLSKSSEKENHKSVRLKRPFREFAEAQLYYTPFGRLYCISITNTFAKFSCADVENEVTAIAHILEKKYDFKFPKGVVCNNGIYSRGGGYVPGAWSTARSQIIDSRRTTYFAERVWSDVVIEVEGVYYRDKYAEKSPCVRVSVTMPKVYNEDKEARKTLSASDEEGIDVL